MPETGNEKPAAPDTAGRTVPAIAVNAVDFNALVGSAWLAEDIDGGGVLDRLQSRLQIVSTTRIAGFAGCNDYHGAAQLDAAPYALGPFATTRKMCNPSVMEQERKFLDALGRVRSARLENGLLHLQDAAGATILRCSRLEP
jgi:putative lipoprotein